MELFLPDQIVLNEVSSALLADVEETARRVNEYRPLPAEVVKRILDGLLGERVYSSNAIEGNTLDLRETVSVLETGRLIEDKKREAIEARNLGEAVRRVSEIIIGGAGVHTIDQLFEIHKMILRETPKEYWGGRFRESGVTIEGAKYQPPDHSIVATLTERVMERLRTPDEVSGLLKACWTHWALARIHPFLDGNGRTARLWQDLVLFQQNLTCAVIRPEDRREYLKALTSADEGEFNPLFQLTAQRILTIFDRYLAEIVQDKELDKFVSEVAGEADTRLEKSRVLTYQRWTRRMEQLVFEFGLCAGRISDASRGVKLTVHGKRPVIAQPHWDMLRLGLTRHPMELFFLDAQAAGRRRVYGFYYRKHRGTPRPASESDVLSDVTLVAITQGAFAELDADVQNPAPHGPYLEIQTTEKGFVAQLSDTSSGKITWYVNVSALDVAQAFLREVVLHRLT